jgi:hypothetical protein
MKKILSILAICSLALSASAQSKLDQDRAAIKSLAGYYKVTFNYAETFAADTAYKFYPRYKSAAYEWATIVEETPRKIAIQHLLVVGDSMVIKHWREDWVYEQPTILAFEKENSWKKVALKPAETKGRWVQKVYQVDDSPRYEGIGTWTHVDGRHEWQSRTDSPLPRREYTKRNDYNVLNRGNRIYITDKGWMFEQDNNKVVRSVDGDKIIAQEKGYEEFTKADEAKFAYAKKWWSDQQAYWKDARSAWDEVFAKNATIKLTEKKDGKRLYDRLFEMAETSSKEKWSPAKNKEESIKMINSYLKQS